MLREIARDLAKIHSLSRADLPGDVPEMDYGEAVDGLAQQFEEAGADRPIIALGLRWLRDNILEPVAPVLNHGDYRLGNLLAQDLRLTGVLDWELAHFGDRHEDLAFGCMAVWRFARVDRPALGLGSLEDYVAAYEAESGASVDAGGSASGWSIAPSGGLWAACGWPPSGAAATIACSNAWLSRAGPASRNSTCCCCSKRMRPRPSRPAPCPMRDARARTARRSQRGRDRHRDRRMAGTVKDRMEGHDRFQLAVARNALGMLARNDAAGCDAEDALLAQDLLDGSRHAGDAGTAGDTPPCRARQAGRRRAEIPDAGARCSDKWTGED